MIEYDEITHLSETKSVQITKMNTSLINKKIYSN